MEEITTAFDELKDEETDEDPIWVSKDGRKSPISKLASTHLDNIIAYLKRRTAGWQLDHNLKISLPPKATVVFTKPTAGFMSIDELCSELYPKWNALIAEKNKRSLPKSVVENNAATKEGKMDKKEKVWLAKIQREKGWLYYFDNGLIKRVRTSKNKIGHNNKDPETVIRTYLVREAGFLYYIDKEGDISRSPMTNAGKTKKPKAKAAQQEPQIKYSAFIKDGWYHNKSVQSHLVFLAENGTVTKFVNMGTSPFNGGRWPTRAELNESKAHPIHIDSYLGPENLSKYDGWRLYAAREKELETKPLPVLLLTKRKRKVKLEKVNTDLPKRANGWYQLLNFDHQNLYVAFVDNKAVLMFNKGNLPTEKSVAMMAKNDLYLALADWAGKGKPFGEYFTPENLGGPWKNLSNRPTTDFKYLSSIDYRSDGSACDQQLKKPEELIVSVAKKAPASSAKTDLSFGAVAAGSLGIAALISAFQSRSKKANKKEIVITEVIEATV